MQETDRFVKSTTLAINFFMTSLGTAVPGKCWQGYFLDADHNTFGILEVDANAR